MIGPPNCHTLSLNVDIERARIEFVRHDNVVGSFLNEEEEEEAMEGIMVDI